MMHLSAHYKILQKKILNFRLILVCFAAASVGLPIAILSIAKTLLLISGAAILLYGLIGKKFEVTAVNPKSITVGVTVILGLFALSLVWTTAATADALSSLGKYGKLLVIPVIVLLLKSRREAIYALGFFLTAQICLMLSSWMLFFQLPVPWATSSPVSRPFHAVFSSYLDQGIMAAVLAALCWHLRKLAPGRFGPPLAVALAVVSMANVFFVLSGRSGHAVGIALISLAIMWELPRRYKVGVFLMPVLLVSALMFISPTVKQRIATVQTEVSEFSFSKGVSVNSGNSSGIRLHFWHRAVQSISQNPVLGAGLGSWSSEFNRLNKQENAVAETIAPLGNPHQEYLLWGVQLGIPGIVLLIGFLLAMYRDTLPMAVEARRSAQSVVLALAIAGLFNSILYDALIGDFFCVVLGLVFAFGYRDLTAHPSDPASHPQPV